MLEASKTAGRKVHSSDHLGVSHSGLGMEFLFFCFPRQFAEGSPEEATVPRLLRDHVWPLEYPKLDRDRDHVRPGESLGAGDTNSLGDNEGAPFGAKIARIKGSSLLAYGQGQFGCIVSCFNALVQSE